MCENFVKQMQKYVTFDNSCAIMFLRYFAKSD